MWSRFLDLVQEICAVPPAPLAAHGGKASTKVFRAAPGWWRYRITLWLLRRMATLAPLLGTLVVIELALSERLPWLAHNLLRVIEYAGVVGWVISLPIGYALLRLDYEMRWYLVTDGSVRIREGVVIVHEMTLTFANVQNVTIEQGPLQRMFGIADLRVQTAGGGAGAEQPGMRSMHTGILRGVDNAEALREAVLARLREVADAGLGDPDDAAAPGDQSLALAATALLVEARALAVTAERCAHESS
jgi:uncharacterized membrane protein YdbT with pleckstrin-like domain